MLRNAETDPIWFLLLVEGALRCAGCESAQQVRQNEMAQARANFGNQLSPEQEAYLTAMLYQRMECYRDVFGKPTPLLFAFDLRFLVEHPECINWSLPMAAMRSTEFFETYRQAASQTRRELLTTYLPLIQAGRLPLV